MARLRQIFMKFLQRFWPFLLSILGGLLLALVFPPFHQAELVWAMPMMLLAAVWLPARTRMRRGERVRKRHPFVVGWIGGLAFWTVNLKWLATVTGPAYLLLAGFLSLYFAVFAVFAATVGNPLLRKERAGSPLQEALRSLAFAALNGLLWCGLEWVRGWLFTGFGWNGLGVAFSERLVLAQGAELVGVSGLSFLPVFIGAVVVQVAVRFGKGISAGRMERHWDFAGAMLVLAGCFFYGVLRTAMVNTAPTEALKVLLVQLDIPQLAWKRELTEEETYQGFLAETRRALAAIDAENARRIAESEGEVALEWVDWVVWPETVLTSPLESLTTGESGFSPPSQELIEELQDTGVRTFLAGAVENEFAEAPGEVPPIRYVDSYNSLVAVVPGQELAVHRKQHLVLYGEFIPFVDSVPLLGKIYEAVAGAPWVGNMGRGVGSERFVLPGAGGEVAVIPSICFEDTSPKVTRKFSQSPREVIVNVTNDGWFGESEGSRQHFANAVFRSIEVRRPMVRAANRGVTSIVSATGSLVDYETGVRQVLENEEGKPFLAGHLFGTVRISSHHGVTLFARFGDWFSAGGLGVAILVGGWRRFRKPRASPVPSAVAHSRGPAHRN